MQIPDICIKSSPNEILSNKSQKLALCRQDSTEFSQIPTTKQKTIIEKNVVEIQEISPDRDYFASQTLLSGSSV